MTTTTAVDSNLPTVQLMGLGTSLDVNSIVTALENVQQIPLTDMQDQVSSYQTDVSAYAQLGGALATFQASLSGLESGSDFQTQTVAVGNSAAASATLSGTQQIANGTHSLSVSQLAQTQLTASSDFSSSSATVGSGTITLQLGTWNSGNTAFTASSTPATTITIGANNSSLQGIATAINSANAGVTASIVNDGTGARLVLTSNSTGAANGFEVSVADSDGNDTDASGLSALAYNPAASGGTPQTTLLQSAANANLTLDGIAISSATNTVRNALQGVSLSLTGTTTTPTTLTVASDTSSASNAVQTFVSSYNSLLGTIASLTTNTPGSTPGPLAADGSVNLITSQLQNTLASVFDTGDASIQSLNDLGIAFQEDGTLTLNQTTLNSALASNPSAVEQLFADSATPSDNQIQYSNASSTTQPGTYALNITNNATQGSLAGSAAAGLTITQGVNDTLNLVVDGVAATVTIPSGTYASATALAAAVQSAVNAAPSLVTADVSTTVSQSGGALTLTASDFGALSSVVLNPTAGGTNLFGASPTSTSGTDVAGTLGGYAFTGSGQTITANANSPAAGLVLTETGGATGARGTVSYSQGIASQLDNQLTSFLDPTNGVIATATAGLTTQINNIQDQESQLEANLQTEQATLVSEFTAMTQLVDSLNQTSSFLSQAFGTSSSSTSDSLGGSSASNSSSSSSSSSSG